jgi:hypothetical protein
VNLTELKTARATAGSRYSAAIAELQAALVDLAALDAALANKNVNPGFQEHATYGIRKLPPSLYDFEHAEFAPSLRARLADQIVAARDTYITEFTP